MATNNYAYQGERISDCFNEYRKERKAEMRKDSFRRSCSKRVNADDNQDIEGVYYDINKNMMYSHKKESTFSKRKTCTETPMMTCATKASGFMTFNSSVKKDLTNRLAFASFGFTTPSHNWIDEDENEDTIRKAKENYDSYNMEMQFRAESTKLTLPRLPLIKGNHEVSEEEDMDLQEYFNNGKGIDLYKEELRELEESSRSIEDHPQIYEFEIQDSAMEFSPIRKRCMAKKNMASTQFRTPSPRQERSKSIEQVSDKVINEKPVRVAGLSQYSSVSDDDELDDNMSIVAKNSRLQK